MNNRMKAILHGRSEPEVLTSHTPINLPHIPEPGKIDVHKQEKTMSKDSKKESKYEKKEKPKKKPAKGNKK